MKKLTRLAIIGGASALALALSAPAFAAYTPKLDVSVPNGLGARGKAKIHFAVAPTDDTTARLVAYSPLRFTVNGGTVGSTIGTADARVRAGDLGGAIVPVPGTIEVRDPSATYLVSGVPVPLALAATQCTGTTAHTAYWVFKLTAAGSALELPAFFDLTAGAEQALGTSKVTFCLPPDDIPPGTPGRSPLGIKLVDAVLTFNAGVYTNPTTAGAYLWSSIWTPYNPLVGTANAAGTVTAVSLTPLPVALTLSGKFVKKTKSAALSGKFSIAGQGVRGIKLPLFAGPKKTGLKSAGTTKATTATGVFAAVKKMAKTTYYQVRFAVPAIEDASFCQLLPAAGLPRCVSASVGGFAVLSKVVKVTFKK
ncbi:MAG TPA: hypothetical protein VFR32_01945 [Gaiellaceae bacterium]|nr:hypothetical protein [Gaiellaceae bacterium]